MLNLRAILENSKNSLLSVGLPAISRKALRKGFVKVGIRLNFSIVRKIIALNDIYSIFFRKNLESTLETFRQAFLRQAVNKYE